MLSEFSGIAGDLAGNLEDLATAAQLDRAVPILAKLERLAEDLVQQVDGVSIEALRRKLEAHADRSRLAGA